MTRRHNYISVFIQLNQMIEKLTQKKQQGGGNQFVFGLIHTCLLIDTISRNMDPKNE